MQAWEELEYAKQEGREEGRAEGQLQLLCQLVHDGLLTITEAAKRAEMTEDEFSQLLID